MRKIVIKKNRHYPFPFIPFGLPIWVRKTDDTVIVKRFMFDNNCLFDLKDEDQGDVNKLFGFSIGYHHRTSFRFGWRPILDTNLIEIVACEYQEGVRQPTVSIGLVKPNKWYTYKIVYSPERHACAYKLADLPHKYNIVTTNVNLIKDSGLGYTLRPYFGGNEKAPKDITIYTT